MNIWLLKLNWLKVGARRTYFVGCALRNIIYNKTSRFYYLTCLSSEVAMPEGILELRLLRIYYKDICVSICTEMYRHSFRLLADKIWNDIPPPIHESSSVSGFKNLFYLHLLNRWVVGGCLRLCDYHVDFGALLHCSCHTVHYDFLKESLYIINLREKLYWYL